MTHYGQNPAVVQMLMVVKIKDGGLDGALNDRGDTEMEGGRKAGGLVVTVIPY